MFTHTLRVQLNKCRPEIRENGPLPRLSGCGLAPKECRLQAVPVGTVKVRTGWKSDPVPFHELETEIYARVGQVPLLMAILRNGVTAPLITNMDFEYAEFVYEVAIGLRNVGRSIPIGCRAQDPGYGGIYHVGQLDIPSLGDQYELDLDFWTEKYKIKMYADINFVPDTADEQAMAILRMQREVPGRPRKMTAPG